MNPTNIFKKCRNKVKNIAEKTASKLVVSNKKSSQKTNKNYQKFRFSNLVKKLKIISMMNAYRSSKNNKSGNT
jgi:hypothetical protein